MNLRIVRLTQICASLCGSLLLATTSASAQSLTPSPSPRPVRVKLRDPMVNGSFLKPYKNVWKVVYAFPGKEPFLVGTWSDDVSEVTVNGRHLLRRTQVANYAKYNIVTTNINVFDPKNMAPIYTDFKRSDTGEWTHRDFDGAVVKCRRGKSPDETKGETGQLKMDEPVFDYHGGMYAILLAAFHLKEGFAATIPTLSEDRDQFEWTTFKVGKQEMVDAGPAKQVMAWPIEIDEADRDHSIFWVTKEAPYVIKLVNIIPKGKWVTVTLSMI
jgi:hypothetical protein